MPRPKGVTQLETLRRKQAELAEQLKAAEAREREREKQIEARREELIGSVIAEHLKREPDSALAKSVLELLGRKLARPADRALFPALAAPERAEPPPSPIAAPEIAQAAASG